MSKNMFTVSKPDYGEKCENCSNPCDDAAYLDLVAREMLVECRSFYFIFSKIEEMTRMPIFQGDSEKYWKEHDEWIERQSQLPGLIISPKVVNGAIACELALKYLILKEDASFEQIHDLAKLFHSLSQEHKEALLNEIYPRLHQNEETFEFCLDQISNSFVKWRYPFERDAIGTTDFFDGFVSIVCEYALGFDDFSADLD